MDWMVYSRRTNRQLADCCLMLTFCEIPRKILKLYNKLHDFLKKDQSLFYFLHFHLHFSVNFKHFILCFQTITKQRRKRRGGGQVEKFRSNWVKTRKLIQFQNYSISCGNPMCAVCCPDIISEVKWKENQFQISYNVISLTLLWVTCFNLFPIESSFHHHSLCSGAQTTICSCLDQCFILWTDIPASALALFQYVFHTTEWTFVNGKQILHLIPSSGFLWL